MDQDSRGKEPKMTLRFTPELHAAMKEIADKERRSLHGQVVRFLEEGVARWKHSERARQGGDE